MLVSNVKYLTGMYHIWVVELRAITIGDRYSKSVPFEFGIPQGSDKGPFLYTSSSLLLQMLLELMMLNINSMQMIISCSTCWQSVQVIMSLAQGFMSSKEVSN